MNRRLVCSLVLAAGILLAGCGALSGGGSGPIAAIQSPMNGGSFSAGEEIPVIVAASEGGGDGIARVEVFVDGALLASQSSPGGSDANFTANIFYTPTETGSVNIMAIAYTPGGMASAPASVTISVGEGGGAAPDSAPPEEPTTGWVQGESSITGAALRNGPGVFCDIIGDLDPGISINLMEYSDDDQWLMTDYLGEDLISWIWIENVNILGNEEDIIHGDKKGCLGCGDGVCTGAIGENCATCAEDCGSCCGNGICEPALGEDCATCEEDCGACEFCGDGICNEGSGETCANCFEDCGPCIITTIIIPYCIFDRCGDGTCNCGETSNTCPLDCGPY